MHWKSVQEEHSAYRRERGEQNRQLVRDREGEHRAEVGLAADNQRVVHCTGPPDHGHAGRKADQAADERAGDAEDDGDDAAGRVPPRNEELRERPGDETEQNPVEPERQWGARE